MIARKSKLTKVKSRSKIEIESKLEFDDENLSLEIVNVVKRMIKRKRFTKRGVKKEF